MPVVVLIVILRALRRQRGGACSDSAGELESDAGSGASTLATPTSTTLKDGHPGPNGACITRQAIPSGLGSACDDRVQQPVALIRQPQIRDMKVCLELRQLPQILVGSYSLVGLDTWAWFFWRHDGINPYMWLSQIEKVNSKHPPQLEIIAF